MHNASCIRMSLLLPDIRKSVSSYIDKTDFFMFYFTFLLFYLFTLT